MESLKSRRELILFVSAVMLCCGCQSQTDSGVRSVRKDTVLPAGGEKDPGIAGSFSPQTIYHFDSADLKRFISKYSLFRPIEPDLRQFYSLRGYTYAWYDQKGLIDQAENLYNHIINLTAEGIPDKTPYKDVLLNDFDVYSESMAARKPENELMLTSEYFEYARSAWKGISEKTSTSLKWYLPRKKIDLPSLMDSLLKDSSGTLLQQGYAIGQYAQLRNYLSKFKQLDSLGNWETIRTNLPAYRPGDSAAVLRTIRKRLFVLGDLPQDNGSPVYDPALQEGVIRFQSRWGLKADGVLGATTLKKMNTTPKAYIRKIMVNMERTRWIPVDLHGNYLVVNIPAFEVYAVEGDSIGLRMKVVVGKVMHKTDIFNGNLEWVVFSPYWNVPPGILKNEVLPALKKDPGYLKRNNMEWNGNSVRQKPGPNNALGLVKFLFPNTFNIYLHDSPAKNLFNEDVRAFSHGCIRVSEPRRLAVYLLRNQPEWNGSKVDAAMHSGKEKFVKLKNPVPVYISYLTAWVNREGRLNFRDDIYQRDDRLEKAILAER